MKYLIFDIESIPNEEVSWQPPEDKPNAFAPIPGHKIVSIGGMLISLETEYETGVHNRIMWFGNFGEPGDERSMILELLEMYSEQKADLVSYNGRGFDVPLVLHRCMRYGIQCPEFFEYEFRYRFKMQGHLDLQDQFSDYGASMRSQLGHLCESIGMPGKMDVKGSDVAKLYEEGKYQEIDSYCLCDVAETAWLFIRFLHLMGKITDVTNHNAVHGIKSALMAKDDEMLRKLLEQTNINRLSLEEQKEELERHQPRRDLFEEKPVDGDEQEESDPDLPF
jgi:predicted PolB exonuclease-like 3'-5' exonuclease